MKFIEFRAYDKKEKMYLSYLTTMFFEASPQGVYSIDCMSDLGDIQTLPGEQLEFEQYINHEDKHGRKIFEGDLLKQDDFDSLNPGKLVYVRYVGVGFHQLHDYNNPESVNGLEWCRPVEIVGNIHGAYWNGL